METDLQNSLLKAISTVVDTRINDLALDKTVVCIIDKVIDSTKGAYRVKYDGGTFIAYSRSNDEIYQRGMSVYVQIPQSNMSNEKNIISRAWVKRSDIETGFIPSFIKDYSTIGTNVVELKGMETDDKWALQSYHPFDNTCLKTYHSEQILYKDIDSIHQTTTTDLEKQLLLPVDSLGVNGVMVKGIDINHNALTTYLENATALLFQADFKTDLDDDQREINSGDYGLKFNITIKTDTFNKYGKTYQDVLDYFKERLTYVTTTLDKNGNSIAVITSLETYIDDINNKLNKKNVKLDDLIGKDKFIDNKIIGIQDLISNIKENKPDILKKEAEEIVNLYIGQLTDIRNYTKQDDETNDEEIINIFKKSYLEDWGKTLTGGEKSVTYVLNSSQMIGDPFRTSNISDLDWTTQYIIIPIEGRLFKRINEITFYHQGFNSDLMKEKEDIFVKNLNISALEPLKETNGDYQLKLTTSSGLIFDFKNNTYSPNKLTVQAQIFKLYYENISNDIQIYWFKKSSRVISANSKGYHEWAGLGWECIVDPDNKDIFFNGSILTISPSDLGEVAYENLFKVIAKIGEDIYLSKEFTIYNNRYKKSYSLFAENGNEFLFNGQTIKEISVTIGDTEKDQIHNLYAHNDNGENLEWILKFDGNDIKIKDNLMSEYQYEWKVKCPGEENNEYTFNIDNKGKCTFSIPNKAEIIAAFYVCDETNSFKKLNLTSEKEKNLIPYATKISLAINALNEPEIILNCHIKKYIGKNDKGKAQYSELGIAQISLYNKSGNTLGIPEYYIDIENGNQIFQYNEYGQAPNFKGLEDPLEIKPLIAHLYHKNGQEIDSGNYSVIWKIPSMGTSLLLPHSTNELKNNWYIDKLRDCEFDIKQIYDKECKNNQIICEISYSPSGTPITITHTTDFFFEKIGNINTNGTHIIPRIVPQYPYLLPNNEVLTVYHYIDENKKHHLKLNTVFQSEIIFSEDAENGTIDITDNILKAQLYNNNELIYDSKTEGLKRAATLSWQIAGGAGNHLKRSDSKIVWDFENESNKLNNFIIKAEIIYEDKTYYAFYPIYYVDISYEWSNQPNNNNNNNNFNIIDHIYDIKIDKASLLKEIIYDSHGNNPRYTTQQGVQLNVPSGWNSLNKEVTWATSGSKEIKITNPITQQYKEEKQAYFSIGDNISDNLFSKTIIPDNTFKGGYANNIVVVSIKDKTTKIKIADVYVPIYMALNTSELSSLNNWDGIKVDIDENNRSILAPQIGAGKKEKNNKFTGIVMGTEVTYKKDSDKEESVVDKEYTGLFGYLQGLQTLSLNAETGEAIFGLPEGYTLDSKGEPVNQNSANEGRIVIKPGGVSTIGGWGIGQKQLYYTVDTNQPDILVAPNKKSENNVSHLDHFQKGILLESGSSPRIIIKGDIFKTIDSNINNPKIINDNSSHSFELIIDPNKKEFFNLYKHYLKNVTDKEGKIIAQNWTTTSLMGIDAQGRFFANSLQDHQASLFLGSVSAFGKNINDNAYFGLNFISGTTSNNNALLKIFTDEGENVNSDKIYIATGNHSNSYMRSMNFYGKNINLYAQSDGTGVTAPSFINISHNSSQIQVGNAITVDNEVKVNVSAKLDLNINNKSQLDVKTPFDLLSNNKIQILAEKDIYIVSGNNKNTSDRNKIILYENTTKNSGIELFADKLVGVFNKDIDFKNGGDIKFITTTNSSNKILLQHQNSDNNNKSKLELTDKNVLIQLGEETQLNNNNENTNLIKLNNLIKLSTEGLNTWQTEKNINIISRSNETYSGGIDSNGYGDHQIALVAQSYYKGTDGTCQKEYKTTLSLNAHYDGYASLPNDENGKSTYGYPFVLNLCDLSRIFTQVSNAKHGSIVTTHITSSNLNILDRGIKIGGHYNEFSLSEKKINYEDKNPGKNFVKEEFDHFYDIRLDATGVRNQDNSIEISSGRYRYGAIQSDISLANYFKGYDQSATFEGKLFKGYNNGTNDHTAMFEGNEFKGITFKGWDTNTSSNNFNVGTATYYGANFYGGNFIGNGSGVTNTAGTNATVAATDSIDTKLGTIITINIPTVSFTDGRPSFGNNPVQFSYKKPSASDINAATIDDIKTEIGNALNTLSVTASGKKITVAMTYNGTNYSKSATIS